MSTTDRKKYSKVVEAFHDYFGACTNSTFLRAKFNQRTQKGLSVKLQPDPRLTPEKAVNMARQHKTVKTQQQDLKNQDPGVSTKLSQTVDALHTKNWRGRPQPKYKTPPREEEKYTRCGRRPKHLLDKCNVKDKIYHKCGKVGHFKRECCTKSRIHNHRPHRPRVVLV